MYRKISIALCIVISLFFFVPLIYIWWNKEPPLPPRLIKGPFISIYLRNLTSPSSSYRLLSQTPNSDFIIDRVLWEWSWNRRNNSFFNQPLVSIHLQCSSNVPVKWEYEGDGGLVAEMRHSELREIKELWDNNTYTFTTGIQFLSVSEQIGGRYVCETVENVGAEQDDNSQEAYFHVFTKGWRTFISREGVTKEVEPDEEILVPCPISDPEKAGDIRLQEMLTSLTTEIFTNVDPSVIKGFDPKVGFRLKGSQWGWYRCVDQRTLETSEIMQILKPRRLVVDGPLVSKHFTPLPKNDSGLRLLCESSTNVTLIFINFLPFRRKQVFYYNVSKPEFPHSSRIILRNEWFTNYSKVECRSVGDDRVLREWIYLKRESSDKTMFRFDPSRKRYECCAEDGSNSLPRLTQAPCYTQTECEMRKSCVNLQQKCPFPEVLNQPSQEGSQGCAVARVDLNPTGILQCSYGDSTKTYLYFYDRRTKFHNFTSTDFRKKLRKKGLIPLSKMVEITQDESYDPEVVVFTCKGPKLFFSNGFQWQILKGRSPNFTVVEVLMNKSKINDYRDETSESLHVPIYKVLESKTVMCLVPIMYSYDWVNATLRYRKPISPMPALSNRIIINSTTSSTSNRNYFTPWDETPT